MKLLDLQLPPTRMVPCCGEKNATALGSRVGFIWPVRPERHNTASSAFNASPRLFIGLARHQLPWGRVTAPPGLLIPAGFSRSDCVLHGTPSTGFYQSTIGRPSPLSSHHIGTDKVPCDTAIIAPDPHDVGTKLLAPYPRHFLNGRALAGRDTPGPPVGHCARPNAQLFSECSCPADLFNSFVECVHVSTIHDKFHLRKTLATQFVPPRS